MAFLTFQQLETRSFINAKSLNESISPWSTSGKWVFLSYRREDRQYIQAIARFLRRIGIGVYIDFLDETLEDKTNDAVAQTLRDRIHKCTKFICLATPNSGKSKWMPWELGLGDRIVNYKNVAILPVTDNPNTWADQEYGKIYGRIERITAVGFMDTWMVVYPNGDKISLVNWLK